MKIGWIGGSTYTEQETINLGIDFADYLEPGDVFAFEGDLASGKTTFTKGIMKGLDYLKPVTSPTFTLVNEYDAKFSIIHIDCYREEEINRWIHLGINDYLSTQNIVIIEWAKKIESLLPDSMYKINFTHQGENKRKITLLS